MTINRRIVSWFESGHAADALVGAPPYFIPDSMYRDQHARLLVLRQLIGWAQTKGALDDAVKAFVEAIAQTVSNEDPSSAYDLAWCLILQSADEGLSLPVPAADISDQLDLADALSPDTMEAPGSERRLRVRRVFPGSIP